MKNQIKNIKIRKWKYKVIVEDIRNAELFNELGEKGWELVCVKPGGYTFLSGGADISIFKKEKM